MNIKYDTGNVIRTSSDFSNFKFPNELPTEEWAGNEARSYVNYIRPIANLFENDREEIGLIKDLYKGVAFNKNSIINGCTVSKIPVGNDNYYEIDPGAFINMGHIYYIFPACEALAKQIEREYELEGNLDQNLNVGDLDIKITYDYDTITYNYSCKLNGIDITHGTATSAIAVISNILTGISLPRNIEDFNIVLPIFKNIDNTTIYFNGTVITTGEPTGTSNTIIATIANGTTTYGVKATINGERIQDATIENSSIKNHFVTIGSTPIEFGNSESNFVGVNSINGIQQRIGTDGAETGDIIIYYQTSGVTNTQIKIPHGTQFTLGTACERVADTDATLTTDANLPTNSAVKGYITSLTSGTLSHFTGNITFDNGLTITNGKTLTSNGQLKTTNNTNASLINNNLSGSASIYTNGGIEAQKDIYSKGNIVGLNSGTYSKRELKENISDFTEDAVELINGIKIVNYNYKADGDKNHKVGFIADDTHEYFSTKNHNIMDQSNCIGVLLKAVQELSGEIKKLKEEINELKSNNATGGEE